MERNHEVLRRILVKGASFNRLEQDDVNVALSHGGTRGDASRCLPCRTCRSCRSYMPYTLYTAIVKGRSRFNGLFVFLWIGGGRESEAAIPRLGWRDAMRGDPLLWRTAGIGGKVPWTRRKSRVGKRKSLRGQEVVGELDGWWVGRGRVTRPA